MDASARLWSEAFAFVLLVVAARSRMRRQPFPWLQVLFFCSGFPALVYQIVWQRSLFSIYGLNIQSVSIVVSSFLLGLGIGSLIGGFASSRPGAPLIVLFAIAEFGTALFGVQSLRLFHWVGEITATKSLWATGTASFGLILLPTILMGATLPLLVEEFVRRSGNVGASVGGLYFANTLGSGIACVVAGDVLLRLCGQSGSVRFAAVLNASVAIAALVYARFSHTVSKGDASDPVISDDPSRHVQTQPLTLPLALACAAYSGFAAIAYEILWYRLLSFAAGDTARVFATLLGSYLIGLALGSRFIERYAERRPDSEAALRWLIRLLLAAAILAFVVAPGFVVAFHWVSPTASGGGTWLAYSAILLSICLGAVGFGAILPLIAHLTADRRHQPGRALSYLYAANILGSTLGGLVVGFILMDHFSAGTTSGMLLVAGMLMAGFAAVGTERRGRAFWLAGAFGICALLIAITHPLFVTIYDRLLFKAEYPARRFQRVIENRSGTIGVTPDGAVFGGGVYDGRFNTDPLHDTNMIVRPYALAALHAAPQRVLMIGLGSGSWAQVVAHHPRLQELIIVEINPGYLQLLPEHDNVASLLRNPHVRIVIDDGRRWLTRHPDERFDAVVMNSTFHWRNHATDLLSVEFLRMVQTHLRPGGILLYNTTGSGDAMATGLSVFRYGLRVTVSVAVSDSPIVFDRARWRATLLDYMLDGKPVIDAILPEQIARLDEIVAIPDDPTGRTAVSIEDNDELRRRLTRQMIFNDDNMGVEWR